MPVKSYLNSIKTEINNINPVKIKGKVHAITGMMIEAVGLASFASQGSICKIHLSTNDKLNNKNNYILAEVVGFKKNLTMLMSFSDLDGVCCGDIIEILNHENGIYPDNSWIGRIVNAFGDPIDDKGKINLGNELYNLKKTPPPPHKRTRIGGKISLGIKSIDLFTSCCYGQRMGIFAGSGVGKSVLVSMLTRFADTDIKVIGLIGERSREAKEFIEDYLGEEGLKKSVIIMATGDESPLMRKRACYTTMAVAEYFRDQGKKVLCIMDSVTRFAMAQREIGLASGEPPTSKGYPPSVFAELPKILERAGPGISDNSSITGIFTVLVDGDDHNEPISDAVRGILDGHIILDRSIASRGRFPAIDILNSVSRAVPGCNSDLENKQVNFVRKMLTIYNDMSDMIRLGAYRKGSNKEVDQAIDYYNKIEEFLKQNPNESMDIKDSFNKLGEITKIKE
ncbi:MAG TPA: flagellar protein export ATPase FliI [Candidatus Megaira endosymbiont of Hartmannula sinica]|nr:flagellar protein export ATPase FliI [Candidatus Megaera endosymbiont of Hartmannula sinica]